MSEWSWWLAILIPSLVTVAGVFLAFSLDRMIERRREDDAAIWAARVWARAMARRRLDGLGISLVRYVTYGRSSPTRPQVQIALRRVDPRVERWWSRVTECLVEADDPFLPGTHVGERAMAWVEQIEIEFSAFAGHLPARRTRLNRLTASLPECPVLSASRARLQDAPSRAR